MTDWIRTAAEAIDRECSGPELPNSAMSTLAVNRIAAAIAAHAPRCETCKHWSVLQANAWNAANEVGSCDQFTGQMKVPAGGAAVSSYDDGPGLETHKDFGCMQWEAK